jgi:hypothetical protein
MALFSIHLELQAFRTVRAPLRTGCRKIVSLYRATFDTTNLGAGCGALPPKQRGAGQHRPWQRLPEQAVALANGRWNLFGTFWPDFQNGWRERQKKRQTISIG